MPRLLSSVNGSSQVGISSDGTSLGNMTRLNYESNRVELDTTTGVATVFKDPTTYKGL